MPLAVEIPAPVTIVNRCEDATKSSSCIPPLPNCVRLSKACSGSGASDRMLTGARIEDAAALAAEAIAGDAMVSCEGFKMFVRIGYKDTSKSCLFCFAETRPRPSHKSQENMYKLSTYEVLLKQRCCLGKIFILKVLPNKQKKKKKKKKAIRWAHFPKLPCVNCNCVHSTISY